MKEKEVGIMRNQSDVVMWKRWQREFKGVLKISETAALAMLNNFPCHVFVRVWSVATLGLAAMDDIIESLQNGDVASRMDGARQRAIRNLFCEAASYVSGQIFFDVPQKLASESFCRALEIAFRSLSGFEKSLPTIADETVSRYRSALNVLSVKVVYPAFRCQDWPRYEGNIRRIAPRFTQVLLDYQLFPWAIFSSPRYPDPSEAIDKELQNYLHIPLGSSEREMLIGGLSRIRISEKRLAASLKKLGENECQPADFCWKLLVFLVGRVQLRSNSLHI